MINDLTEMPLQMKPMETMRRGRSMMHMEEQQRDQRTQSCQCMRGSQSPTTGELLTTTTTTTTRAMMTAAMTAAMRSRPSMTPPPPTTRLPLPTLQYTTGSSFHSLKQRLPPMTDTQTMEQDKRRHSMTQLMRMIIDKKPLQLML